MIRYGYGTGKINFNSHANLSGENLKQCKISQQMRFVCVFVFKIQKGGNLKIFYVLYRIILYTMYFQYLDKYL